jgi:hypothetical protein
MSNEKFTPDSGDSSTKPHTNSSKLRQDAEFIRALLPSYRPPKKFPLKIPRGFDYGTFAYVILIAVVSYLLVMDHSKPLAATTSVVTEIRPITPMLKGDENENSGGRAGWDKWWNLSLESPCAGIDYFYSGKGFMHDWEYMIKEYDSIYNSPDNEPFYLKPPEDIVSNSTGFDCEDIAHATRCLSGYYNVECSFWTTLYEGPIVPKSGHLGVCCNADGWKCI